MMKHGADGVVMIRLRPAPLKYGGLKVMTEMTDVKPVGRLTYKCAGLYSDDNEKTQNQPEAAPSIIGAIERRRACPTRLCMQAYVAQTPHGIQPTREAFTSRRAAGTNQRTRMLISQNRRETNKMPIVFYLPFIIATGMLSVAAESMRAPAKQQTRAKND